MAGFTFQKATKKQAKARVGISGPAGAGKTYTALLLATSMCERVAVIDTEHGSASKYADEFSFDVLELDDFHPTNYIKAIQAAESSGYDGLVIDSISHEWSGKNGCLELAELAAKKSKGGNRWAGWADVTPLHNAFIEAIHSARLHIFATMRSKMDYIQTEDSRGKTVIQKVGMAPITRDGVEYEFDIVGEMDLEHNLVITKSRCKTLADKMFRLPGAELAAEIKAWLSDGAPEAAQHGKAAIMETPSRSTTDRESASRAQDQGNQPRAQAQRSASSPTPSSAPAPTGDVNLTERLKAVIASASQKEVATNAGVPLSSVAKAMSGLEIPVEDKQKIEAYLAGGAPAASNGNGNASNADDGSLRRVYFAVATSALSVDSETAKAYAKWKASDWLERDIDSFNDIPADTLNRLLDYIQDAAPDKLTREVRTMRRDMGLPDDVPTGEEAPYEQGALV